jgi:hypothetical protein
VFGRLFFIRANTARPKCMAIAGCGSRGAVGRGGADAQEPG